MNNKNANFQNQKMSDQSDAFEERYEEMVDESMRQKMTRDEQLYSLKATPEQINHGKYADLSAFESKGHRKVSPEEMKRLKRKALLKKIIPIAAGVVLLTTLLLVYLFAIRPANQYNKAKQRFEAQNYKAALSFFEDLGDYKDSEKYTIYLRGILAMQDENYDEAVRLFDSLDGFLDSKDKSETANQQTSSAILEKDYTKAAAYLAKGDYTEAEKAFLALGDYKDSKEKAAQAKTASLDAIYAEAVRAQQANNFTKAKELFESLGDYKDAKQRLADIEDTKQENELAEKYEKAKHSFTWGHFNEAYTAFTELGSYSESERYAAYCSAMLKQEKGEYEKAAADFEKLESFLDSADQVLACRYKIASDYLSKGEYEKAIELFRKLGDYQDSEKQLEQATEEFKNEKYKAALYAYHDGKYDEALALFEALGDYKDTQKWIAEINNKDSKE
ncbi:MAG: tetratricopeptide repeat protein [Clostridiales bacterium]|nr:tetratricopeptide repeat protein [Clostridiales bacterium]